MAELPPRARILAEYFASIVLDATSNLDDPPTVRCRRRPPRQRCPGIVMSYPSAEEDDRSIGTVRSATTTASSAAGRARSGWLLGPTRRVMNLERLKKNFES